MVKYYTIPNKIKLTTISLKIPLQNTDPVLQFYCKLVDPDLGPERGGASLVYISQQNNIVISSHWNTNYRRHSSITACLIIIRILLYLHIELLLLYGDRK